LVNRRSIRFDQGPLLFLALVAVVATQWAGGQIMYGGDAIVSSLYLIGLALAWWIGANSASPERTAWQSLTLFASLVVAGAAISVFIATLQWLRLESNWGIFAADRGLEMRPFGNLGQPNHLATLALMGIAMSCALYLQQRLRRWQLFALVAWLSWGLILTESRTGLLGAVVLGAFFIWRGQRTWGLGDWKTVLVWWAGLLALASLLSPLNDALLLQASRGDVSMARDNLRMVMWRQSLSAIQQAPWMGYGWRQTVVGQKAGANVVEGTLATDYAHNLGLDLLLWVGVPIGILLLILASFWLVTAARKSEGSFQFLLLAGILPVGVHSMLEFPFAYSYFLFPVGWMLGALAAAQSRDKAKTEVFRGSIGWVGAASGLLVFAGLCFLVAQEYLKVEEDYRVMRFELRRLGQTPAGYEAPKLALLTQLDETLKVGRMVPYPGMPARDIERLRIANASQAWATLHLSYAVALALNGQPEEATRQLQNLRALYGAATYKQVSEMFLRVQAEQYPQLVNVTLP
jgi:O-antigen ligase